MDYIDVDVKENELEDLIRVYSEKIEPGLKYIDHQNRTDKGRLDVIFVDSGSSLVVAELKIIEDDNMLLQALDYFDYISENIEAYGRIYKDSNIDVQKPIRIMLIAPSFSQVLISRSKWINASISLYNYKCIRFDGVDEVIPIFNEISIPTPKEILEEKYDLEDRINYVTNNTVKQIMINFIEELKSIDPENILVEAIKYSISVKINGKVFLYVSPRRDKFLIEMNDVNKNWTAYPINGNEDIEAVRDIITLNYERRKNK